MCTLQISDPSVIITHFLYRYKFMSFNKLFSTFDRTVCYREMLFNHNCIIKSFKYNFSQSGSRCRKSEQIQRWTDGIISAKKRAKCDIPCDRAENAKRGRLRGNGILSLSADGPLISAAAMFPKCFVPFCFEPYFILASSLPSLPLSAQTIRRD